MPRYDHVIKRATSKAWPSRVLCLDATCANVGEIDSAFTHTPEIGAWNTVLMKMGKKGYEYNAVRSGKTAGEYWDMLHCLCSAGRSLVIISSNTSRTWTLLDLWGVLETGKIVLRHETNDGKDEFKWASERLKEQGKVKGSAISCGDVRREIDREAGYLVMRDSPCIARFRLRDLKVWVTWIDAGNYGIERPADVEPGNRAAHWLGDVFKRYHLAVKEYRLGKHCLTAGGQASYGWRYGYYVGGIAVQSIDGVDSLQTSGYYGARAECAQCGVVGSDLWCFDARNAYAECCRSVSVPVRPALYFPVGSQCAERVKHHANQCCGRVGIATPIALYPVKRGDITIWPTGRFQTVLSGPELQLAFQRGHVTAVHEAVQYHTAPLLQSYAEALYGMRCDMEDREDKEMKALAKLLLNTLVGRFAQREIRWEPSYDSGCDILWGEYLATGDSGEIERFRSLGGSVFVERDNGYAEDALPAVAAWITSAARVKLLRAIEAAGWQHACYWDTDCVMVDAIGRDRLLASGLVHPKQLGALSERWGPEPCEFRGVKYYKHGDTVVCAGAASGWNEDAADGQHYYHQQTPIEDVRNKARPSSSIVLKTYYRTATYRHGVVMPDGKVVPFVLEE